MDFDVQNNNYHPELEDVDYVRTSKQNNYFAKCYTVY